MTTLAIDPAYDRLLHEIQPKAIHTREGARPAVP